jgi:hypothetical protein
MPIMHITGPKKSGKSLLANSMRNTQITNGLGALLVDEDQEGEPRYLLEKIVAGVSLGKEAGFGPAVPRPAADVPWKGWTAPILTEDGISETEFIRQDPLIIFVGDKISLLDEFELITPGFLELFGPVREMKID